MQPVIYIYTEDKNEVLFTTKIIKNDAKEYQVLSSNYFNLGIKESELKEFSAPIKNNKIRFGFFPSHNKFSVAEVNDIIIFDISKGKVIDNRFIIKSDDEGVMASFSIHKNSNNNMSLYGPVIGPI